MRALLVSDLHLSDRPPSSCTDSYTDDLFGLLAQAAELARQHCDVVVIAGDVFHCKAPSRNSHRLVLRLIAALRDFAKPVYIVPGNHDITYDRLDSLHTAQPLGVVFASGAARMLDGWAEVAAGPLPIFGIPWQQGYGEYGKTGEAVDGRLGRIFASYHDQVSQLALGNQNSLVVAHAPLYPPGKELPYEFFPAERWAEGMRHGQCFYGHVHEPHGTYVAGGVTFCNNGALSRGSLHEYNLDRQVGVTIWDSESGQFDFWPLDARPASEVFRLAERGEAAGMAGRLEEFLEGIGRTELAVVSTESVLAHVRGLEGVGPAEAGLIEELLAGASDA